MFVLAVMIAPLSSHGLVLLAHLTGLVALIYLIQAKEVSASNKVGIARVGVSITRKVPGSYPRTDRAGFLLK